LAKLAFSPDGATVAAGAEDGRVKLWDVATGRAKDPLHWHTGAVRAVAFSPDGRFLASGEKGGLVVLCDAATGRRLHTFKAAPVENLAFSPDGQTLAAVGDAPDATALTLRLWDLATKREVALPVHTKAPPASVPGLAFHPGGHFVATSGGDGTVAFWYPPDPVAAGVPRCLRIGLGPINNIIWQVAFTPEGRYLVTANGNAGISILRVPQPPVASVPGPPVQLPDPAGLAKRPSPADALQRADIPAELLARAGSGQAEKAPPELVAVLKAEGGHLQPLYVAFGPDGQTLASSNHKDSTIKLWDLATGKLRRTLTGHGGTVFGIAFSPDGQTLASASADETINMWEVATGKVGRSLRGHTGSVIRVAFSPDGKRLASTSFDGTMKLWDATTGKHLRTFTAHRGEVHGLAFSPDGKTLATGGEDAAVRLWDVATGWEVGTLLGHRGKVRCVAFRPDGRTLASCGHDQTVRLWDLAGWKAGRGNPPGQVLEGHEGVVLELAWRPDGRLLASHGHEDGTVRLWDLTRTPRCKVLRLFPTGQPVLHGLAFSPEGRYLATANLGGTAYVLRLAKLGEVLQVPAEREE
jgi:WD40 repeat protein